MARENEIQNYQEPKDLKLAEMFKYLNKKVEEISGKIVKDPELN